MPDPALPCPAPSTTAARPQPASHQYNARDICLSRHMHTVLPYLPSSEAIPRATSLQTNPRLSLLVNMLQGSTPTVMPPLVPVGSYPARPGVRLGSHQTPRQGYWPSSSPSSCYPILPSSGVSRPCSTNRVNMSYPSGSRDSGAFWLTGGCRRKGIKRPFFFDQELDLLLLFSSSFSFFKHHRQTFQQTKSYPPRKPKAFLNILHQHQDTSSPYTSTLSRGTPPSTSTIILSAQERIPSTAHCTS